MREHDRQILAEPRMPNGYEPLPASVVDALGYAHDVTVLECETGALYNGKVRGVKPDRVRVEFGNKHIEAFYARYENNQDDGKRLPTTTWDGEFMLVRVVQESDVFNAFKASVELLALRNEHVALARKYDALMADHLALAERVMALESITKPRAA